MMYEIEIGEHPAFEQAERNDTIEGRANQELREKQWALELAKQACSAIDKKITHLMQEVKTLRWIAEGDKTLPSGGMASVRKDGC